MILKKDKPLTELEEFIKKFPKKKGRSFGVDANFLGEILTCSTTDKEIIMWLKNNGFHLGDPVE